VLYPLESLLFMRQNRRKRTCHITLITFLIYLLIYLFAYLLMVHIMVHAIA